MFINGLQRILNCSKVQVAATGLASTWLAVHYAAADLPPTQRSALWIAFVGAVAVQLREIINAWTEEDVARLGRTSLPANGAATGTWNAERDNTAAIPSRSTFHVPASVKIDTNGAIPASSKTSPLQRNPSMPPRTKLPLILLAFSTIALLGGCQSCPELAIYREGLHRIDEPLYQAHLLLMNDAVKAGVRSDADRQVVQQGIAAARGLYQQAAATQPTQ